MKKLCTLLLALLLITAALTVTAAAEDTEFVYDWAGILSSSEISDLTSTAERISQAHNVGVYIVTLPDMRDYGFNNIESCAEAFYDEMLLGLGSDRAGIMLIMSMADRDYDLDSHGRYGNYAFTKYGKTTISDRFLDNFSQNDWYGGFRDYLSRTEELLIAADSGNPVDITVTPGGIIACAVISLLIAWLVCSLIKSRMKSAKLATDADSYVQPGGAQITNRQDHFTHTTQVRRRIETSDRSGGGGGGGGHSHSSGKF